MMLNIATDYSIRTLIMLAASEKPIKETEISNQMQIPQLYLTDVIKRLKSAGFICESGGENSGYSLAKNPDEISVREIFETGGEAVFAEGGSEDINPRVRKLHGNVHKSIADAMAAVTLGSLARQAR
jgi:Rrf2 family protein